jgi:glycosyltransferase involved in cell wall biosynthesis
MSKPRPEETRVHITLLGPAPPDRGGIAHETAHLAEELGHLASVEYLTFSRTYPRWLDPRRFAIDPRLAPAPAVPVLDYLSVRSWRGTAERAASLATDALLVPWWTSFWAMPVRTVFRRLQRLRPETRRVLLCHNLEDHEAGLWARWLSVGVFSESDAYLVHSDANRRELLGRFPSRPVESLSLPAPEIVADRGQARRTLGIEGRLVLFLGLVRPYKGVDVLLAAAPRIVRETGAKIAIVGEVFEDARPLKRMWEASPVRDRVIWKDEYVSEEEMGLWLAACDLLALPYRRISSSAIAARGIGARRPVVAAAVGGLKEAVVPGQTGELFEPGDANGLADAVSLVFAKGPESYASGLARALREASWPAYAKRIVAFLERCRAEAPDQR